MNDIQIKCFIAAAKYENFTKAAEAMFMAQPVLGRHILNLEKELGFALFDRSRKAVRLTENGKVFEAFVKQMSEEYLSMMHRVQEKQRTEYMELCIGAVEGQRIENYFSPVLRYIVENRKRMTVSAVYFKNTEALLSALSNEEIDAAIAVKEIVPPQSVFSYKSIGMAKSCLVVPARVANEEKDSEGKPFGDLPYILRSEEDNKMSRKLQMELAERFGITNFITVPNLATLMLLVKSGVAITTVPDNQELCFEPSVCCIPLDKPHCFFEYLLWCKDNNNPAIKVFCKIMDETGVYGIDD